MSTQLTPPQVHPVHGFAGAVHRALDRVADAPVWAMTPAELAETLMDLDRAEARLRALRLTVLAAADRSDVAAASGAAGTAAWLAAATRENRNVCHGDLRLANRLADPVFEVTRAAYAAGRLTSDQVRVLVAGIEDLPSEEVTDADRVLGQQRLVELAAELDAKHLAVAARRLFEVLAPEEAERREGEALEREERRAREQTRFGIRDNGDGTSSGSFKLPTAAAEMLAKAVQAFAAPRRTDAQLRIGPDGRKIPHRVLLGHGFAELIEHLPGRRLPKAGGLAATVVVTVSLEALATGLGAGTLDTGTRISAGQARRLACNAGIIPMVLDGESQPLDVGRSSRLHTAAQRTAMVVRDRGCTALDCDRPPAWCEAHHDTPWSQGGGTSLANGRLLCPRHHHMAHDPSYDMRNLPNGEVRFHKRT